MLNKIRFAFTGVFLKLQNVIRNQVHFNTFGGGYTWGGGGEVLLIVCFFCVQFKGLITGKELISGESGVGGGGGRQAYKQQFTVLCKCAVSLPA